MISYSLLSFLTRRSFEMNVKVEEPGKDNVHNNAFYPEEELLRTESQAMRDCNPLSSARHWIVCVWSYTHPRLEDWPVMPVEHVGFMLMPHGFFNCSPAVDVPPSTGDCELKDAVTPTKPIQHPLIAKL
ncbi:unnamed protein product [Linum tenue]|uniref:Amine oxidase n=1 Tax=Linum tenue TaxID=586396 RepID=A0AAV0I1B4_9ROSI|nr:unnamed protein product [Linum tenue]